MSFVQQNKPLIGFLVKLGVLCGFYFLWFKHVVWTLPVISTLYGYLIHYLLVFLGEPSIWVLDLLGYDAVIVNLREIDMYDLEFNIHIRNFCLGVDMMFALTALIVSFPGKWINRLWFIPLGLIGIQIINIARVVALCIGWARWGTDGPIDHHDVYNVVAVVFIFLLFRAWVNLYKKEEPAR
jgi:exosortase/archaeosortase family protein